MQKVRTAVLPVAGLGTRVLPATKSIPKELLPVVDRPVIQYVVDEARAAGIEQFVFVTGRNKGAIEDYFDKAVELEQALERKGRTDMLAKLAGFDIPAGSSSFVRQKAPLGLGHAVWCARHMVGDAPFAVLLPDVIIKAQTPCLKQLIDVYDAQGGNVIAVDPVPWARVGSYGVVNPTTQAGNVHTISGMTEKPAPDAAPSNLAITGRYILQPEIFALLEKQGPGAGNEIQLTDSMLALMETQSFRAVEFEGTPLDCGSIAGYFNAVLAHGAAHEETADVLSAFLAAQGGAS